MVQIAGFMTPDNKTLDQMLLRGDLNRTPISEPKKVEPFGGCRPPEPKDAAGKLIPVTVHVTECGEVVEHWVFSNTNVQWYRVESPSTKKHKLALTDAEGRADERGCRSSGSRLDCSSCCRIRNIE